MKSNMSTPDRIMRIIIAVAIATLYFSHVINGMLATVLLAVAGIFVLTSFISFCPLYLVLGINTKGKEKR